MATKKEHSPSVRGRAFEAERRAAVEERCKTILAPMVDRIRAQIKSAPVPVSQLIGLVVDMGVGCDVVVCGREAASRYISVLKPEPGMERVVVGALAMKDDDDWLRFVFFLPEGTIFSASLYLPSNYLGEA